MNQNSDIGGMVGTGPVLVTGATGDVGGRVVRLLAARAHAHADRHLAASGLSWTVLRASAFMQNFTQQATAIRRGLLPQTSGRGEVSWIDTADVAAVAHHVLTHDGHLGATYFLTGPESLSVPQVAERFASVLHEPVRYVHLPSPLYALALRLAGRSWFVANGLRHQFADVIRRNADIDTTHEVHRLLGRPPRSITAWITDNIDQFTQSNRRSAIPALTRFRRIR